MPLKALIVFASLTGNTEEAANFLNLCFKTLGIETKVVECQQVNATAFQHVDICVVATYTYGNEGNLPEEIEGFYEELGTINLKGKIYGTLGTGEEDYGYFCKSADDFATQFGKVKALKGADVLKIEENPGIEDKKRIVFFAKSLIKAYKASVA